MELIKALWYSLFPSSVQSIVSDIDNKVNQLNAHSLRVQDKAEFHDELALKHKELSEKHIDDSLHARKLADKFKELIS